MSLLSGLSDQNRNFARNFARFERYDEAQKMEKFIIAEPETGGDCIQCKIGISARLACSINLKRGAKGAGCVPELVIGHREH